MRAPGNAGDKRVKRKRGSRSAAAVAARIERGYLMRVGTAGSTACVINHVDSRGTGTGGGSHDDTRTRKTRTASAQHDRHARTARAERSGRHTGDWQARPARRRSDEVRGLVVQTDIVLRSRGISGIKKIWRRHKHRRHRDSTKPSTAREVHSAPQMYHILVVTTAGAALDK